MERGQSKAARKIRGLRNLTIRRDGEKLLCVIKKKRLQEDVLEGLQTS